MSKQTLPSNLLHELAGSISGIHGFATVLGRRMQDEFLDMVLTAANEAIATIRDMQLVESIETGEGAGTRQVVVLSEALPEGIDQVPDVRIEVDPALLSSLVGRVRAALTDEGEQPALIKVSADDGVAIEISISGDLTFDDLDDGLRTGRRRFRPLALTQMVAEQWGGAVRVTEDPTFVIELPVAAR
ncbi:MAG: hypothetical protein ACLGHL_07245 [Actinomycetota bacterium]